MTPFKLVSSQLRKPSGWFGRLVIARFFNRYNQRIIDLAVQALQIQPEERVLDIGFGGGVSLGMLARSPAAKVYGVDLSDDMVAVARKRFDRLVRLGKLDVKTGDISALPYGNETFDKVCTINTIYFWPEPLRILAEIRRVLKPGGRLVVAFRSRRKMQTMQIFLHGFTLYSLEEVRDLLLRARFQDVRMDCYDRHKHVDSNLVIGSA